MTDTIKEAITEAVTAGADLLDRNGPDNWPDLIDLDPGNFDMSDPSMCVLGWVYDSYARGISQLQNGIDDSNWADREKNWPARHGFESIYEAPDYEHLHESGANDTYRELTMAWRELIEQRQGN